MGSLPIYRAKEESSSQYYESTTILYNGDSLSMLVSTEWIFVDSSTLSISFPNMTDKNGKRIFASLYGENGIGGDVVSNSGGEAITFMRNGCMHFMNIGDNAHKDHMFVANHMNNVEIVGIKDK